MKFSPVYKVFIDRGKELSLLLGILKNRMGYMSIPKYEQLKGTIKQKIEDGTWQTGEKIPPQRELEEKFDVSRITVKKAVSDLISQGYLEHLYGKKGVFIKKRGDSNGSQTIAVAIDDVTDRFGATLLRGIEDCLWERKYHTIICNADRDFSKVEEYFHSFDYGKVDGIIFSPVIDLEYRKRNTRIIELLKQKAIPVGITICFLALLWNSK